MIKEVIISEKLNKPVGIFSHAVKVQAKSLLFISGITARDRNGDVVGKGDIRMQTKQVLENMKIILDQVNASFDDIVKVTVFVADMNHFKDIHEIRSQYFKRDLPASSMVEVSRMVSPDFLIEIEAIAAID